MVFCAATFKLAAQTPFNTTDSIDINNIAASVLVHGDMWWNPALGTGECKFPKGTGRSVSNAGAVWMSGYDAGNNLHVAAQTYKQAGNDYWPGPLDISGSLSYATSALWAHIWKINRTDISAFHSHLIHTTYNTPLSILSWPGKGNVYGKMLLN